MLKRYLLSFFLVFILSGVMWLQSAFEAPHIPSSEEPTELYANQNGDDLTQLFAEAIGNAKKSIILVVYTLKDKEITSLLRKKSKEGIDVYVVCDANASPNARFYLGNEVHLVSRDGPGLMHQKILIIDKQKVWIGSANMTRESLELHGNLVMGMDSAELAEAISDKALSFNREGKAPIFDHLDFIIGGQEMEMWFLPDDRQAVKRLQKLLSSAKKTIQIAMFTWTHRNIAQSVIAAAQRGVKVEVVIDNNSAKGASSKIVELLKSNGIQVSLGPMNKLLHHKFLYIDHTILVNGSANWTANAFSKNDDCFVVLHDLTQHQQQTMDSLWNVIVRESMPLAAYEHK